MWTTRLQTYYYYIFCFHSRPTCLSPGLIENLCSFVIIFKWQWTISFLSRFFSVLLALPWLLPILTVYMSNRNYLPFGSTCVHARFFVGFMLLIFSCVVFICLVYPILPVSLDCWFLIFPSVFSNVYFKHVSYVINPIIYWFSLQHKLQDFLI